MSDQHHHIHHLSAGSHSAGPDHGSPPSLRGPFLGPRRSTSSQGMHRIQLLDNESVKPSRRVASQMARWKSHFTHLRRQRAFLYLTIIAAIMVIVNIVQAALIEELHDLWWIIGVPLAIFLGLMLALIINATCSYPALRENWQDASAAEKTARIGIVASILLPIVLCQFIYLPLVAVPDWHTISWASDLRVNNETLFPAMAIVLDEGPLIARKTNCAANIADKGKLPCEVSGPKVGENGKVRMQYVTFDPAKQPNGTLGTNSATITSHVDFDLYFDANSTFSKLGTFKIALYDAHMSFNLSDYNQKCGNPPFYHDIRAAPRHDSSVEIVARTFYLDDRANALDDQHSKTAQKSCSMEAVHARSYTYYDAEVETTAEGTSLRGSSCDLAVPKEYKESCSFGLRLELASSLVTTQKSRRGTGGLKILIDEGSILGGVLFFTWFLGIFVV